MSSENSNPAIHEQEWKPSVNPILVSFAVMLATFMVVLDTSVANVALPHMAGSFSSSNDESLWILTSYLISNAVVLPSTAYFSSFLGRKNFLILCIIIFTAASAMCGSAQSLNFMIFSRILQGLGGGALMPISQAILLESFPKEKRGFAMALYGLGVIVAPIIGPTLGGWITDNYSWHWIFFINIPFGVLAVALSQMFIEDPPYVKRNNIQKIDYIGFSALIIWLVTLQVVLDNGQKSDWFGSSWVCWTSAASLSALIFFIVWEFRFKDSIIDLTVFKDRNFTLGSFLSAIISGVLYSTLAILPLFLQSLLGYTAYHSGLSVTPRGIGCLITILLSGILANKVDNRILIALGFIMLAAASFMFGNLNLEISMSDIVWPNILCGAALGFLFTPMTMVTFATLNNAQMTNATGLYNLVRNIGGSIGVSVVSTMISRFTQIHQTYMVEHLSPTNPLFQHKIASATHFLSMHMNDAVASSKANYLAYGTMLQQATLCSFIDNFRFYGVLSLLLIPTAFIFKKIKNNSKNSVDTSMH